LARTLEGGLENSRASEGTGSGARCAVTPPKRLWLIWNEAARHSSVSTGRTLLELYGVTGAERDGLIQLTREARQPGWWHSFRDVLPNPYEVYIGLEAGAASIRNYGRSSTKPSSAASSEVPR